MTLLAAFQILLSRYTGQTDIVVGSPIANRNQSQLEDLIGFFVNSLVLRADLSHNPTFRELLARVREVTLGAYAHQDLPFEKLVQELHPERDLSRHPLFQVAIALQNTPITALELPGLALSRFEFDHGTSRLDLEFHLWQSPEGLQGQVTYSTDLFDRSTINRLLGHYQTLLAGIIANPDQRLADLPLLSVTERQQLLVEWNRTSKDYPAVECLHQLFAAQASRTPAATAVVFADQQLTYQALNQRSNQLAHYLQKLGVGPEVLVGICLERSLEMVIGILGILKAGGAYVPLDPSYPPERLRFMLNDAQVSISLTQASLAPFLQASWGAPLVSPTLVCLDRDWPLIDQQSQQTPSSNVRPDNLAYLIYTSGSTGVPKGVLVEHQGLYNLAEAQIQTFELKPEHRVLQFASLSFDASIFEMIMAWGSGATLYILPAAARSGTALIEYLRNHAITQATLPPAVLITLQASELPALHLLIAAGEACPPEIVNRWVGDRRFFNAYGLTETTVWATVAEVNLSDRRKVPIGRGIANTQLYVLDADLQPLPVGIPGQLYIGGAGLARGYLNRPELTAERFISTPYSRLYKTGDLVRYLADGNLEFLGRLDTQVKIRGFRIELDEIASVLGQHAAVRTAIVVAREQGPGHQQLVAYIVPTGEQNFSTADLRCFLQEKLPDYMIPSAFVVQPSLPLTAHGKVNQSALPEPAIGSWEAAAFVAPRTPTEAAIAALWAQLLNLEQVGIQDNFFELGGDSLLAIRLLEQINQQFQQNLPLADLFLAPNIEQLALLIQKQERQTANPDVWRSWSPLVPLQPTGSRLPFFCVHPIFGVVLPYYELACQLGTDQPFYGLQPMGMDGNQPPCTQIEEMAAHYIEALRQVQPQGPYQLGGWSFGGLVAFEMAQQLRQAGAQVRLLAILDAIAPIPGNRLSVYDGLKFLVSTVARSIWPFLLDYGSLLKHRPQTWLSSLERATITHFIPPETRLRVLDELTLHRMLRIFATNSRAVLNYAPQAYPDPIVLFRSCESPKQSEEATLGWSELATGTVQVHQVPGNHLTMLRKPHVQVLAQQLHHYLAGDQQSSKNFLNDSSFQDLKKD
jgi:amino acid adenylation domain-containing protein